MCGDAYGVEGTAAIKPAGGATYVWSVHNGKDFAGKPVYFQPTVNARGGDTIRLSVCRSKNDLYIYKCSGLIWSTSVDG
jgi:hypothetical protein